MPPGATRVRLDKWLWAARFYKTRSQAAEAINDGRVTSDKRRLKTGHFLAIGERLDVRKHGVTWELVVLGLSSVRGSGEQARLLYEETVEGRARREEVEAAKREAQSAAPYLKGRPTKRDRRALDRFQKG